MRVAELRNITCAVYGAYCTFTRKGAYYSGRCDLADAVVIAVSNVDIS
jgi:hypothetical protein